MRTVFVLVDAMKSAYVTKEYMPFLYSFSQEGHCIKKIYASPGFCERCELFSGLNCYETGNFCAIGYDPLKAEYESGLLYQLAEISQKISGRATSYLLRKYRNKKRISLNPYRIPPKSLKYFFLTEDGSEKIIDYGDIFDVLDNNDKSYTLEAFTSLSDYVVRMKDDQRCFIQRKINEGVYFIPVYVGIVDQMGHKYGSMIEEIAPFLKKVDDFLAEAKSLCTENGYRLAVLGDHGMIPVKKVINIPSILSSSSRKLHKDYEMFLDSTMLRIWFFDENTRKEIETLLYEHLNNLGIIVNQENYNKHHIPLDIKASDGKSIYGDFLWCANPGILLVPDYFNPANPSDRGMHGYLLTDEEHGVGFYASDGKRARVEKSKLKDVCGALCELLEIEEPNGTGWERRLKDVF